MRRNSPTRFPGYLGRAHAAIVRMLTRPSNAPRVTGRRRHERLRKRACDEIGSEVDQHQALVCRFRRCVPEHERLCVEDRSVQQILGQVDVGTLAAALFGAEDQITDKVFRNLSRRAADMLKEELQFAGRVGGSKVDLARNAIVKLIAKTEQEAE